MAAKKAGKNVGKKAPKKAPKTIAKKAGKKAAKRPSKKALGVVGGAPFRKAPRRKAAKKANGGAWAYGKTGIGGFAILGSR
jgi:hypothetical protein